ncbi:MAG: hypothetical protein D6674_00200 [Acidobacteria bacterium]|jgi:hypothetical protein|nr:MAG: hypothetical protein D6674_00200 [Acidobacteriota bacterium]
MSTVNTNYSFFVSDDLKSWVHTNFSELYYEALNLSKYSTVSRYGENDPLPDGTVLTFTDPIKAFQFQQVMEKINMLYLQSLSKNPPKVPTPPQNSVRSFFITDDLRFWAKENLPELYSSAERLVKEDRSSVQRFGDGLPISKGLLISFNDANRATLFEELLNQALASMSRNLSVPA